MIDYDTYWNNRIQEKHLQTMPRHREIVRIITSNRRSGKVLDLGCGEGHILNMLPNTFDKYGCDVSKKTLSFLNKKISIELCDLSKKFPFENILFDIIICSEVLEHLENPKNTLKNSMDHLAADGMVLITIPNYKNIGSKGGDPTHIHSWKVQEFVRLLENQRFLIEDIYPTYYVGILRIIFNKFKRRLNKLGFLSRFLYNWSGEQILFTCRKKL